jgi:hypothetical protein
MMNLCGKDRFFMITVVDDSTGRGVPLVEISLVNGLRDYTDSNGVLAFFEPALMNRDVFFQIRSHGYRFKTLVHGMPGVVLKTISGQNAVLTVTRVNVAERLYRITGEGIYCHSMLSGRFSPIGNSCLNADVMGQDTVLAVAYRKKIFWFWGDTWGVDTFNFAVAGATSQPPDTGGLNPSSGVELSYFVDDRGFAKPMCPDFGYGRVWLDWVAPVRDGQKEYRLLARFTRVASLDKILECGFALFNDRKEIFEPFVVLPEKFRSPHLSHHPFIGRVNGKDYLFFTAGFEFSRVRATLAAVTDPMAYEYFGRYVSGDNPSNADRTKACLTDRTRHIYGWKKMTGNLVQTHLQNNEPKTRETPEWIQLLNIETGACVDARPGSIFWNNYCRRWILIAQENIGQVWFAEADTPVGPWVYSRKVVSHSGYNFYNPTHHPFFDQRNGRMIYFEGTYTHIFSGSVVQTPRYDYNQIMYRLDLAEPRLSLPQPVYRIHDGAGTIRYTLRDELLRSIPRNTLDYIESIDFFAMKTDRNTIGLIPVYAQMNHGVFRLNTKSGEKHYRRRHTLFYALPLEYTTPAQQIEGLWECKAIDAQGVQRPFGFHFKFTGQLLKADISPDQLAIIKISYSSKAVNLILLHEKIQYQMNAEFTNGQLTGHWHTIDGMQAGTCEGQRVDFAWKQGASSAVVPLYEYWNPTTGSYIYSTICHPLESAWVRSGSPLCRVWKNPITDLVLDYETEPILTLVRESYNGHPHN